MKKWKEIRSQQQTKKFRKVFDNMIRKKEIDEKLADYLYIKRPQLGRFYLCRKSIR